MKRAPAVRPGSKCCPCQAKAATGQRRPSARQQFSNNQSACLPRKRSSNFKLKKGDAHGQLRAKLAGPSRNTTSATLLNTKRHRCPKNTSANACFDRAGHVFHLEATWTLTSNWAEFPPNGSYLGSGCTMLEANWDQVGAKWAQMDEVGALLAEVDPKWSPCCGNGSDPQNAQSCTLWLRCVSEHAVAPH